MVADAKSKPKDVNPTFEELAGNLVQLGSLGPFAKIVDVRDKLAVFNNVHWVVFRGSCFDDCQFARYVKYSATGVEDVHGGFKEHNAPEPEAANLDFGPINGIGRKEFYPDTLDTDAWKNATYVVIADAPGTPPGNRLRWIKELSVRTYKFNFLVQVTSKRTRKVVGYIKYDVVISGQHVDGKFLGPNGEKEMINKAEAYDVSPDPPIEAPDPK